MAAVSARYRLAQGIFIYHNKNAERKATPLFMKNQSSLPFFTSRRLWQCQHFVASSLVIPA
ncbi:MAG: hypothetical protein LBQ75_07950 [Zoogloeaceae bacterium]|nr:hypothetical protein [Zoogloeaceae bacterium]